MGIAQVSPVFTAIVSGDASKLEQLLKNGADPNQRTPWGWAALHQAMFAPIAVADTLLNAGADANVRIRGTGADNGWTPLFFAATQGRQELITDLLNHGADVNAADNAGHTALFYAIQRQQKEVASLLVESGTRPLGFTPTPALTVRPMTYIGGPHPKALAIPPLFQAVRSHNEKAVAELLKNGADPNERAPDGWMPLHQAMYGDVEICRLLIAYGADVNARVAEPFHSSDFTPLLFAASLGRVDMASVLLQHGADTKVKDSRGKTPLMVAKEARKDEIVRLLLAASDQPSGRPK